jgi:glucosamine--fructose-6-phosphate aminotransferase (isomerizing)
VIDNFQSLKDSMIQEGHTFSSSTDTEVLAHLIGKYYAQKNQLHEEGLVQAVRHALNDVTGTYGIAVLCKDCPDFIVGARRGSPLIVGIGNHENLLSSDINALSPHTREVVYLHDFDLVTLTPDHFHITRLDSSEAKVEISKIDASLGSPDKGGFPHFMLKEIFEQPQTMVHTIRGRIHREESSPILGGLNMSANELRSVDRVVMMACGTSWHAALTGEFLLEEIARIPCEVEYASEFRYRNPPLEKSTLFFAITQSGETADTLAALREAKRKGFKALGICNVVGSTIARESDGGVYLRAGPEIGVASTKAFTSQVTVLALISILMGRLRDLSATQANRLLSELELIPDKIAKILEQSSAIQKLAVKYKDAKSFLYLGRQCNYPVALEGALKLKEITYIHAEGYPAAEMKHGPIALIDSQTPSLFLCPRDAVYDKTMSNLEEVKARSGPVLAIATEGDHEIRKKTEDIITIPQTLDCFYPLLTNIPLQLFAYHMATALGRDVDKPRNLAKSVTVE